MVSAQFNLDPKAQKDQNQAPANSPGDDRVLDVNEGDGGDIPPNAQPQSLNDIAAAMNEAAEHGDNVSADALPPVDPDALPPVKPEDRMSEPDKKRMSIGDKIAQRRREEMLPGQGVGPVVDDAAAAEHGGNLPQSSDLPNMNAEHLYYGQFGNPNKNFAGEEMAPPPPPPADAPAEPDPSAEPAGEPKLYTVTVNGQEKQVSEEELIRNYQQVDAGNDYLNQAKDILAQAKSVSADGQNRPAADGVPADQTDAAASSPDVDQPEPGLDELDYQGIAEKIQLGETEEGANALKDLVTQVVQTVAPRQDAASANPAVLGEQVANIVQDRTQSEQARTAFEEANPEIVADDHLYRMAHGHAHQLMVADFENAGADDTILQRARTDPQWTANAHRALRVQGFEGLKTPEQLYQAAGDHVRGWLSSVRGDNPPADPPPPPPPENRSGTNPPVNRQERARAAQQSPARRQAPPQQPAPQEPVLTPAQLRSKKIAEMKVARNQFPAGQRKRA